MIFVVEKQYQDMSVESFLKHGLHASRSIIRKIKHKGYVLVNGNPMTMRDPLHAGDMVTIVIHERPSLIYPQPMSLDILYEDEDILVLNKPSGCLVHPVS